MMSATKPTFSTILTTTLSTVSEPTPSKSFRPAVLSDSFSLEANTNTNYNFSPTSDHNFDHNSIDNPNRNPYKATVSEEIDINSYNNNGASNLSSDDTNNSVYNSTDNNNKNHHHNTNNENSSNITANGDSLWIPKPYSPYQPHSLPVYPIKYKPTNQPSDQQLQKNNLPPQYPNDQQQCEPYQQQDQVLYQPQYDAQCNLLSSLNTPKLFFEKVYKISGATVDKIGPKRSNRSSDKNSDMINESSDYHENGYNYRDDTDAPSKMSIVKKSCERSFDESTDKDRRDRGIYPISSEGNDNSHDKRDDEDGQCKKNSKKMIGQTAVEDSRNRNTNPRVQPTLVQRQQEGGEETKRFKDDEDNRKKERVMEWSEDSENYKEDKEKRGSYIDQIANLESQREELLVENTALSIVLLRDARESLQNFCSSSFPSSSLPSHSSFSYPNYDFSSSSPLKSLLYVNPTPTSSSNFPYPSPSLSRLYSNPKYSCSTHLSFNNNLHNTAFNIDIKNDNNGTYDMNGESHETVVKKLDESGNKIPQEFDIRTNTCKKVRDNRAV
jgi:hypothetical protein